MFLSISNQLHVPLFRVFLYSFEVYSFIDSSKMINNSPEVSNFNRLFLKLNQFICNQQPVEKRSWCKQGSLRTWDWRPLTNRCILRSLIGRKGWDRSCSLYTRRWRSKGLKKLSWMLNLCGRLWIMFHGLSEFALGPPPRGRFWRKFQQTMSFESRVQPLDESQGPSQLE